VLSVNARFQGQRVTGVQRYATEVVAALVEARGHDGLVMLSPADDASWIMGRLWEAFTMTSQAQRQTGSPATLNLCNWGPIKKLNAATIVIHDLVAEQHPEFFSPYYRTIGRQYLNQVKRSTAEVFTVSSTSQKLLERRLDRPVGIAPCGVSARPVASEGHDAASVLGPYALEPYSYALLVGAHDARKNAAFASRLIPGLTGLGLQLALTERSGGRAFAGRLERSDNYVVITDPTDVELWALYRQAAVLLHPSHAEGFGLPLLEAASEGTPFVSSDVGAARDLAVADYQVVPLVEHLWMNSIRDAIRDRDEIARRSARTLDRYSWSRTAETLARSVESRSA